MTATRSRWAAIGAATAITLGGGGLGIAQATSTPTEVTGVELITSCRMTDTRPGGQGGRNAPLGAGAAITFAVTGTQGDCVIPANATAIVVNLTGLNATTSTNLTAFAADVVQPKTSMMNLVPGKLASNEVSVPLSADGKIKVYNHAGATDILLDITGYYTTTDLSALAAPTGYTDAEIDALFASAPFVEGWHRDQDGDGFGDPFQTVVSGTQPAGYVSNYADCNDYDPLVNPDEVEVASSPSLGGYVDENCDGAYDVTFADDVDLDGWGGLIGVVTVTVPNSDAPPLPPSGKAATGDCDDADPQINPWAFEDVNVGVDYNCDGLLNYYPSNDNDSDGYGYQDPFVDYLNVVTIAVGDPLPTPPPGQVFDATDCDDSDPTRNPGATEIPDDFIDSNCNFDDNT